MQPMVLVIFLHIKFLLQWGPCHRKLTFMFGDHTCPISILKCIQRRLSGMSPMAHAACTAFAFRVDDRGKCNEVQGAVIKTFMILMATSQIWEMLHF